MRGTVKKDEARGTWFFVADVGVDPASGKRRQVKRRSFRTRRLAEDALKDLFAESRDGAYVEPSAQPVRVYLEKWLAGVGTNRKASTAAMYAHKMRRYVIPRIGAMPLRAVDPTTLDVLYAELLASGGRNDKEGNPQPLSAQTVAVVHRILHRAFADAVRRRAIRSNPADFAEVPESSEAREIKAWSSDELRAFLDHIAGDRLHALWVLAALTGMRRGEVCGVKWSDVNLDTGQLVVHRSRVPVSGRKIVESTPKSKKPRSIALAPATVAALRAHRRRQREERLACGPAWQDTGYMFTNEDGSPLRPDAVTQAFNDHVTTAELPRIVLHVR